TLEELRSRGVEFVSYQENIDTSTPQGRMFFGIVASIAEFERSLIVERINAGLRRARQNGIQLGRPSVIKVPEKVLRMRQEGHSLRQIAQAFSTSKTTIFRLLAHGVTKTLTA
ncbi:MAG: recombinase family protein, partial [Elusimicrobiota bacterium]